MPWPSKLSNFIHLNAYGKCNRKLSSKKGEEGWFERLVQLEKEESSIKQIPENIGDLINLEKLNLRCNQITSLPESIGQLSSLRSLNLSNNQLTALPECIGNLTNLRNLYLGNNQLTALPESIGNLTNLRNLYLGNNQLSVLPESIGQLSNLQWFIMDGNPIKAQSYPDLTRVILIGGGAARPIYYPRLSEEDLEIKNRIRVIVGGLPTDAPSVAGRKIPRLVEPWLDAEPELLDLFWEIIEGFSPAERQAPGTRAFEEWFTAKCSVETPDGDLVLL